MVASKEHNEKVSISWNRKFNTYELSTEKDHKGMRTEGS